MVSGKSGVVPGKATWRRLCGCRKGWAVSGKLGWFSAGCWFQERLGGFRKGTKSVCDGGSWSGQVLGGFSQIPGSATTGQVPSVGGTLTWLAVVSRKYVWFQERRGGFRRCWVVSGKPGWFQERLCVS